jgi:ABC-type phosphate/phosphonate transport system substrate-binding protein
MYDRPQIQWANDALWRAVADRLLSAGIEDVPLSLERGRPLPSIWDDPSLLLAQCCGYPFATQWRDRLTYVATPIYTAAGCDGSAYRSRIVVRADGPAQRLADLRHRRAAYNERGSNSGLNLFRAAVAPLADSVPFFSAVEETGSHVASARLVARGGADVAAIDTISLAHLERHEPETARHLRVIGFTEAAPGLPLVTAISTTPDELAALRNALAEVARDPALSEARTALLLEGFELLSAEHYDSVIAIEHRAISLGYPALV